IKASIVAADEREMADQGVGRAALNLGHTIGHAVESQFEYSLRHGEAVALGLVAALDLAVRRAGLSEEVRTHSEKLLSDLGLAIPAPGPINAADLRSRLLRDKKARAANVRFVVPASPGNIVWLSDVPDADLAAAIARINPS